MTDYAAPAEEMIRRVGAIQDEVGAGVCFGVPIERNGHTIVPVARVSFGYGMGFGGGSGGKGAPGDLSTEAETGEGGGGGGGGRGSSTPVAVIDIAGDQVKVTPLIDSTRIVLSSFVFLAWVAFWLFLTVRTVSREAGKTRREQLKRS